MKFTILGSSGFIGSHLAAFLKNQDIECFLPFRDYKFSASHNLGHIIYCIGITSGFRSKPIETVKAHVCKLIEVLENSSFQSLLYLSSTRVYNGSKNGDETAVLNARSSDMSDLYNLSKLMGEALCFANPDHRIRIARLSNVVGDNFNSGDFLISMIKSAVDTGEINLNLPAGSSKDYIAIGDVTRLLQLIALKGKHRIYNISSGQPLSNRRLVDEIRKHTDCKIRFLNDERELSFPVIENKRIRKEFSFIPRKIIPEIKLLIKKYQKTKNDSN
ncbi:MAG: NAD(P)-dependent oxidoreductase [Bacteroidetes bacterium]|nr:NAD(P)-dependent oxidoreductase [Bacteroidota bacterium]